MDPEVISYLDHSIMLLCASCPCYICSVTWCVHACAVCVHLQSPKEARLYFFNIWDEIINQWSPVLGPDTCEVDSLLFYVLTFSWLEKWMKPPWNAVLWAVISENMMSVLSAWKILLNRKCAWMISVFADVSCQTLREGLWCGTPLSCGAAGNWKRRSGECWRREEEVEDESGAAAHQGFLGHGTRKWTSLVWPAGAYAQKKCEDTHCREARAIVK